MPYLEEHVPADIRLKHNNAVVFHAYEDGNYNAPQKFLFTMDNTEDDQAFDIRELKVESVKLLDQHPPFTSMDNPIWAYANEEQRAEIKQQWDQWHAAGGGFDQVVDSILKEGIEKGLLVNPDHNYPVEDEVLPGATPQEIIQVMMQDIVGDYDVPDQVSEWAWVEQNASFSHCKNGQDGVWEFVLNLGNHWDNIPEKLTKVIGKARERGYAYLIFHQGT